MCLSRIRCILRATATALAASRDILVVVPSHVFGQVLRQIKPLMRSDARLVWATKGLEAETGRLLQDVAREALGDDIPLAVIRGQPSPKSWPPACRRRFRWRPRIRSLRRTFSAYCTAAKLPRLHQPGLYRRAARRRGEKRHCHRGRYVGWHRLRRQCAYGADYPWAGGNVRLGAALGADPETFMGMAGLGDLVLTCTDNQSRNRRFGMMLGGMDVQSARGQDWRWLKATAIPKEVRVLAQRLGVEMPITEEIYQVLYCGKIAREAALTLLGRAARTSAAAISFPLSPE